MCISLNFLDLSLLTCERYSASLAKFGTGTDNTSRCSGLPERQDAIEEAPMSSAWRATGLHGA